MLSTNIHHTAAAYDAQGTVRYGVIKQLTNSWCISIYVTTSQGTATTEMSDIGDYVNIIIIEDMNKNGWIHFGREPAETFRHLLCWRNPW